MKLKQRMTKAIAKSATLLLLGTTVLGSSTYIYAQSIPESPNSILASNLRTGTTVNSQAQFENRVLELVNIERKKVGLKALQMDENVRNVARLKSEDMRKKNYFDHISPTYGSPFEMLKTYSISYKSAGENIAKGQTSPEAVVKAWMNSPGHRANILSKNFTHMGVGYVASGSYWTQMFIGK